MMGKYLVIFIVFSNKPASKAGNRMGL
jgi:hypothetical protein